MKYKVGDKVRVRDDLKIWDVYGGIFFIDDMEKFKGKVVEIEDVYSISYSIKEDRHYWADEMFSGLAEEPRNLIPLIAKELGVEIGEEFYIENWSSYKHRFTEYQLEVFLTEWTDVDNETYRYVITNVIQIQKLPKKPKLTEAERVILENLPKECKYIARDYCGELYIYGDAGTAFEYLNMFSHLFQFMKLEDKEPYNIEELLEEYETLRSE